MQVKSLKSVIITCAMLASLQGASQPPSLPQGGTGKGASIATTGKTMTITPAQERTWIDWQSYDVGPGHKVVYNQGPSHLTVNNVVGAPMSHIAGTIDVRGGHAFLINPNGIIFTDGARVQGNMIFSTLPMDRKAFSDRGEILFNGSGLPHIGSITQSGTFEANGLTAFVGPHMALQGKIIAALQIYAGNKVAAHLGADGLMGFDVTQAAEASKIDVNDVQGQYVIMSAGAVGEAVQSAIHIKGHVAATGMKEEGGNITIYGGDVTIHKTAHLDVDGAKAGGSIRIGVPQDYVKPNKTQLPLVRNLIVEPGAYLSARSQEGPGGNIFLLAQQSASFQGSYDVSGLTQGGQIELSSRYNPLWNYEKVLMGGRTAGRLTLDPEMPVSIVWSLTPGASNEILASAINQALATGHVTVETADHPDTDGIVVSSALDGTGEGAAKKAITWSTNNSLTLIGPEIVINGHIIYTGGAEGWGRLNLKTTTEGQGITGTGTLNFNGGHIRTFNTTTPAIPMANTITLTDDGGPQPIAYTLITTVDQLKAINQSDQALAGHYALHDNIDISGEDNWQPIGNDVLPFTGRFTGDDFHGGNHEIQGLTLTGAGHFRGLFGKIQNATLDHLGVTVASFNVTGHYNGPLVGFNENSTISHSYATGNVTGSNYTGGLVGFNSNSTISHSYATGNVTGSNFTGGLVGCNWNNSTISHSYATGNVTGNDNYTGGLVGLNINSNSTISHSYATGNVTGNDYTGGLVGFNDNSTISHSYATGNVTGNDDIGGLVGLKWNNSTIMLSYATGNVTGNNNLGGAVGRAIDNTTIRDAYSSGLVNNAEGSNIGSGGAPTYSVGDDGRIAMADWFNPDSAIVKHFLNPTDLAAASYGEDFVSPWAAGNGVLLHLPGTAVPIVRDGDTPFDVYVNSHRMPRVTLNETDHTFIPPNKTFIIALDGETPGNTFHAGRDTFLVTMAPQENKVVIADAGLSVRALRQVSKHFVDNPAILFRPGEAHRSIHLLSTGPFIADGAFTLDGNITTDNLISLDFTGPLTLTTDVSVGSGASRTYFASTINGPYALTLEAATAELRGGVGGATPLKQLTVAGDVILAADITTGMQTYHGTATLANNVMISSPAIFKGALDGAFALHLASNVTFAAVGQTAPLAQLIVGGNTTFGGNITTTGPQTYHGAATLTKNVVINGPAIFKGALDGAFALQLGGNVTFATVGQTAPLAQLTVGGNTTFGGNITTTGTQTYEGTQILQPSDGSDEIRLKGAADGLTLGGETSYNATHLFYNDVEVLPPAAPDEGAGGGGDEVPQGNDPVEEPAEGEAEEEQQEQQQEQQEQQEQEQAEQPAEQDQEPDEQGADEEEQMEEPADKEEDEDEEEEDETEPAEGAKADSPTTTPQQETRRQSEATLAPNVGRAVGAEIPSGDPNSSDLSSVSPDSAPASEGVERAFLTQALEDLDNLDLETAQAL